MGDIREILKKLGVEVLTACKQVCAFFVRSYNRFVPFVSKTWSNWMSTFSKLFEVVKGASIRRKTLIGMALFLTLYFSWQIFAYSLSQTVFVIVNLLFVSISSILICIIIFSTKKSLKSLEDQLSAAEAIRKKKEKEISAMKKEIHDYKIAAKNQTSFGKNSQALIDSVKKYKQDVREGEGRGQYILRSIALHYEVCCGLIYMKNTDTNQFDLAGQFALSEEPKYVTINEQDGLAGMAIIKGKVQTLKEVPSDFFNISSGLGQTSSLQLYILPLKKNGVVEAVIEVASFGKLPLADIWPDIDNILLNE